ncbi:uncharacterized protein PG998_002641 [Apiospora kogelbergensis]|uniref:uncharacterized protein n=1 Tax=Apiospora kogelbergensis TaxID=1337665 RepID=UPI00312EFEAE
MDDDGLLNDNTIRPVNNLSVTGRVAVMTATTRQGRGFFQDLPNEILIQILPRLTNLTDLGSVLHASPTVYRIFDTYAIEITQAILESGYVYKRWGKCRRLYKCGDTTPRIRCFILFIILLHSSRLPATNLADLHEIIFQDHPIYRGKPEPPGGKKHGFDPVPIPIDTPSVVIRSVIATARRMTWLALDCLQLHLARFRQVQPAHPVETKKAFQKRPEAKRKNYMLEPGTPTLRFYGRNVSYELWLPHLYDDVKTAATHSGLGWPAEDVEALNSDGRNGLPWRRHDSRSQVLNYLQETHGQSSPASVRIPWERLQTRQREGPAPAMRDRAIGVARGIYRKSNALALGDFASYERLDFGFWCFERMWLAGFLTRVIIASTLLSSTTVLG